MKWQLAGKLKLCGAKFCNMLIHALPDERLRVFHTFDEQLLSYLSADLVVEEIDRLIHRLDPVWLLLCIEKALQCVELADFSEKSIENMQSDMGETKSEQAHLAVRQILNFPDQRQCEVLFDRE